MKKENATIGIIQRSSIDIIKPLKMNTFNSSESKLFLINYILMDEEFSNFEYINISLGTSIQQLSLKSIQVIQLEGILEYE